MTARQVFDKRVGGHHADEARADARGHRLGRRVSRLRRARNITGQALNVDGGVVMQ